MHRIQAQLTENQARRLKQLAASEGVSVAELLRRAADLLLESGPPPDFEERWRRADAVVGAFEDSATDVAAEHDRYLVDAYGR